METVETFTEADAVTVSRTVTGLGIITELYQRNVRKAERRR